VTATGGVPLAWLARQNPDPAAAVVFLCGRVPAQLCAFIRLQAREGRRPPASG
jgi:hypothetical protein